jgi:hypothetical protein
MVHKWRDPCRLERSWIRDGLAIVTAAIVICLILYRTTVVAVCQLDSRRSHHCDFHDCPRTKISAPLSSVPAPTLWLRTNPSHVCRVTPAIDEPSNSLRNVVLPMAANDPALLNTILAVSHSPHMPAELTSTGIITTFRDLAKTDRSIISILPLHRPQESPPKPL